MPDWLVNRPAPRFAGDDFVNNARNYTTGWMTGDTIVVQPGSLEVQERRAERTQGNMVTPDGSVRLARSRPRGVEAKEPSRRSQALPKRKGH
jgi:hypothetical protein